MFFNVIMKMLFDYLATILTMVFGSLATIITMLFDHLTYHTYHTTTATSCNTNNNVTGFRLYTTSFQKILLGTNIHSRDKKRKTKDAKE